MLINMVELDHQRSAAKISVNKMSLDIFVYVLIHFDEY